jgi:hypothetical protein
MLQNRRRFRRCRSKGDVVKNVDAEAGTAIHTMPAARPTRSTGRRGSRRKRFTGWKVAGSLAAGIVIAILGLWMAINRVPSVGPWLADTARSLLGTEAVSQIESWAYDLDDRWNRWWRRGAKPEAHWTTEAPAVGLDGPVTSSVPADAGVDIQDVTRFAPSDVGPLFREVQAEGDGIWVLVLDPMHPAAPPVLYKSLIHPDRQRPWAELFVAAIDLRQADLFVAAGTVEPVAETPEGEHYVRTGLVPEGQWNDLVAAFNGGFKAEHGHYGMKVDGVTLLAPRPKACTIARYGDGALQIGTWSALAPAEEDMVWWRQTPACMVEGGRLHPGLVNEESRSWGAALGGETVVRRSAIGLDRERKTLFVGVSNATTARAIALGMQHVGATDVAQLDINWSYPHVVMFRPSKDDKPEGFVLFDGFAYEGNTYISRRSQRDFFYITQGAVERPRRLDGR